MIKERRTTRPASAGQARQLAALAITLLAALPALGQVARTELHPLASVTLSDQQFLTGANDGPKASLAAELRIPLPGTARLPAVVLAHGSGGAGANLAVWAEELNSMGIATLLVDSFTGRGIANTLYDQTQLSRTAMIVDLYRALELLAKHPRIDPSRIAVMGFSRGGMAALYSSVRRFQRMHAPADASFAAYIAFYPACNTTYIDDADVADRPIRVFFGTADDYVPIGVARAYVARLKAAGKEVQLSEYPGAHHSFDNPGTRAALKLERAPTARKCNLVEDQPGHVIEKESGAPFSWKSPCVESGPTVAYDEKAAAEATRSVKEFLAATFKLKAGGQK